MADSFIAAMSTLDKIIADIEVNTPRVIIDKALPPALTKISTLAAETMRPMLPDGVASGTRAKQSKNTKKKFPYHMKDRVKVKLVKDAFGMLAISGVDRKASHVHFDFGKKAKSTGRKHILWGRRPAKVPFRVQRQELQDIPGRVLTAIEPQREAILAAEIIKALQNAT